MRSRFPRTGNCFSVTLACARGEKEILKAAPGRACYWRLVAVGLVTVGRASPGREISQSMGAPDAHSRAGYAVCCVEACSTQGRKSQAYRSYNRADRALDRRRRRVPEVASHPPPGCTAMSADILTFPGDGLPDRPITQDEIDKLHSKNFRDLEGRINDCAIMAAIAHELANGRNCWGRAEARKGAVCHLQSCDDAQRTTGGLSGRLAWRNRSGRRLIFCRKSNVTTPGASGHMFGARGSSNGALCRLLWYA